MSFSVMHIVCGWGKLHWQRRDEMQQIHKGGLKLAQATSWAIGVPLNQYIGRGSLVFCRLRGGGSGFFQLLGTLETFWSPWAIPELIVASSWGRPFPSISGIFLKSNLICIKVLRFWLNEFLNIHMYIFKCAHQCIYSQILLCT